MLYNIKIMLLILLALYVIYMYNICIRNKQIRAGRKAESEENMKFKDLYKVLVKTEFYYIKINTVEKETLRRMSSEIISMTDLPILKRYFDKEVQCIHSMKYDNKYDYNITLFN